MEKFKRKAQVNEVDTFSLDDIKWLDGESIVDFTVTQTGAFVDVVTTAFTGTIVTAKLKGLVSGSAMLHYRVVYSLGRSHCVDASVIVLAEH